MHVMARTEQKLVLFQTEHSGVFSQRKTSNLEAINAWLQEGWRVVMMSPTSSPSTDVGQIPDVYALVLLERDID
jgi:hypothetical protein